MKRVWPASWMIWFSFLLGSVLSLFPLPIHMKQWWPDWLLLLLIFWSIHQPQLFSVGSAFLLGLAIDAMTGSTLAMHAIPYAGIVYLTRWWGQNFPLWNLIEQYLFVILLLIIATVSHLLLVFFSPLMFTSTVIYLQIVLASLLAWPVIQLGFKNWQRPF